jgi:hypothetical protein
MEETKEMKPTLTIYQRILAIMSELKYVAKGEKTVNGQYRFVSHDSVTAKIHPLLVKHGVIIIPTVVECKQEGNRTQVKLDVIFRNAENASDHFYVTHFGFGVDNGDKGIGKAVSYAFKYALLKTFCLETGEDPDQDANSSFEPEKCFQFDMAINGIFKDKEKVEVEKFLNEIAKSSNRHVEEVKREALKRLTEFTGAFEQWQKKEKKIK